MKYGPSTSAQAHKQRRRDIRRAFGPEFQEAVETFMQAHEAGLRNHGAILEHTVLGSFWKRVAWLLCGAKAVYWTANRLAAMRARVRTWFRWCSLSSDLNSCTPDTRVEHR